MAPLITLYILGGCVALAVVLFIIMIVVSAMRPPQLPDVSMEPPLQRVIRALTPPFALPTSGLRFDAGPTRNLAPVPSIATRPSPPRLQAPAARPAPPIPQAVPIMQRVAAPSAPALNRAAAPMVAPSRSTPPSFAARPPMPSFGAHIASRRAVYPVKRTRPVLRLVISLFVTATLAAGALVAYPAMLDAPCDEIEWFGTDAALVVRAYAREAHVEAADFIEQLQDTPAITAPQ